jgi:hypothetical protein
VTEQSGARSSTTRQEWPSSHDGHHRKVLNLALHRIEASVGADNLARQPDIGVGERIYGFDSHLLGDAAHFGARDTI